MRSTIAGDADDPSDDPYWLAYGPAETSNAELVRVCDTRWQVEECFAQAKGAVGVDQYEIRTWMAWHRFVTLCLLAHAFLLVVRCAARREETVENGALPPASSHSPCRKRAAWSWRWQETRRADPSDWPSRTGAGHSRRSPPAAMPRAVHASSRMDVALASCLHSQ